jgi:hypothetical protein
MALVCSRCTHIFDNSDTCPRCGADAPALDSGTTPGHGPRWQQTAWGRILIGLILAQGMFYGLRHLITGLLLATSNLTADELWADVRGLLILQALQIFGLLFGSLLAGGGQRSGLTLGAVVGAWNGVLAVLLRQNPAQELTLVGLYGQPMLHIFIGAIGGFVGSLIWKPIPSSVPVALAAPRKQVQRPKRPLLAGKVLWLRILFGAALAVAGTLCAGLLLQKVMDLSGGKLETTSAFQDRLITWEIKALALVVGGALAGATAPNGLKQGLIVGLVAGVALVGIQVPTEGGWLEAAGYTALTTFSLCAIGGWFGGELFPPVIKVDRNARAYA